MKNHQCLFITNELKFKTTWRPKLKMLNQTVNLETDAKTLYYSLLQLKYSHFYNYKKKGTKKTKLNMHL